jgi:hypothetical protein
METRRMHACNRGKKGTLAIYERDCMSLSGDQCTGRIAICGSVIWLLGIRECLYKSQEA